MCPFSAPFLNAALEKGEKKIKKKEKRLTTAMSQSDERFKCTVNIEVAIVLFEIWAGSLWRGNILSEILFL